jgi:hypothetical protein
MRGNGWVSNDYVARSKRRGHLPDNVQQGVIVRNKNLNVIAHFGELGGRSDEVRNRTRISIPHENVEPTFAQIFRDPASDDTESKDPNVFSGSTRHVKAGLSVAAAASSACGENRPGAIQKFVVAGLKWPQITGIPTKIDH